MAKLNKVTITAGSDAVFYIDGKIISRETYATDATVYTYSEHFVGSEQEVTNFIEENSLT